MASSHTVLSRAAIDEFLAAPWLAELDTAARVALLNVMEERREPAGTVILEQGQPNDHIIFLMQGSASVLRTHPDGRTEHMATLDAPSIFGLTSFFRPTPPNFSVRSRSIVWYLTLDHPAHDLLRKVDVRAAEQVASASLRILSERFDQLDQRLSESLTDHPDGHPRINEWSEFRARLMKNNI